MLEIGKQYTVTCKNLTVPFQGAPETSTYTGYVIQSAKYDPPESVRISTGIREFPIRVIQKRNIIKINDQNVRFKSELASVKMVKGSNGDLYTVTTQNGRTTCSCPGFSFRKTCKHIGAV